MKYIRTSMIFIMVILAASLTSCSPDTIEEYEEEEPEEVAIEEPAPPEPSWADGIITITTGNYQTVGALADALAEKPNFAARRTMIDVLQDPDFPMSGEPGTTDVTVVTLKEAGFTEPATLEEIRERYRELGYRPLTLEEAVEFRLQFTDQPDISEPHLTEEEREWSCMFVLVSEQDAHFIANSETAKMIPNLYRSSNRNRFGEGFGIGVSPTPTDRVFDPQAKNTNLRPDGSSFACAIIQ